MDSNEHQQVPAIPLHAIPSKLLCLTGHPPAEIDDCEIKLADGHSTTQRCVAGVSKAPLSASTGASRRTRVNAAMRQGEREREREIHASSVANAAMVFVDSRH